MRSVRTGERVVLTDLGFAVMPADPASGERLIGDYGILYRLTVDLVNPTSSAAVFTMSALAISGPSRGMLQIAGTAIDFGLLHAGEERILVSYELGPGETRTLDILTMPAAGSFFPVRLSVWGVPK